MGIFVRSRNIQMRNNSIIYEAINSYGQEMFSTHIRQNRQQLKKFAGKISIAN